MQTSVGDPEASTQSSIEAWSAYQYSPLRQPKPLARGMRGAISGTTGGSAVGAGLEILKQGGSAADAALATSLGQIALAAGSWVSYAGVMVALYYDAEIGKVQHMNAGWNTFLGENDPLSIPFQPEPSGRTAMVGGFMAGVQAMHDRYGNPHQRRGLWDIQWRRGDRRRLHRLAARGYARSWEGGMCS